MIRMVRTASQRSDEMERLVAELASVPLMRENVFHSARFLDGAVEKELCDVLLVHRGEAIVISVKAQNRARDRESTVRWLNKHGPKAVSQLAGAYRTLRNRAFWSMHPVTGRRDFEPGSVHPVHGLALLDSSFEAPVAVSRHEMERLGGIAPVTLMTIADFSDTIKGLRTWRDLREYLDARNHVIRHPDRCVVGSELELFTYYVMQGDSFDGCVGLADARLAVKASGRGTDARTARAREWALASILEDLLTALPGFAPTQFPDDLQGLLNPLAGSAAEVIRDDLCNLSLQERAALGEQIGYQCASAAQEQGPDPLYGSVRFDRHPDKVYLVVVGWKLSPDELLVLALEALIAACVFHRRHTGVLLVANEVGDDSVWSTLGRVENIMSTPEMEQRGIELFGHVRPRKVGEAR